MFLSIVIPNNLLKFYLFSSIFKNIGECFEKLKNNNKIFIIIIIIFFTLERIVLNRFNEITIIILLFIRIYILLFNSVKENLSCTLF